MAEKPDIRVLVDVDGGASIDGKSGQRIANTLEKLAKNISAQKRPHITFDVDFENTAKKVYKQLNEIVKSIKIEPIDLQIRTNQSSIGSSFKNDVSRIVNEYNSAINSSDSKSNTRVSEKKALAELEIQKAKELQQIKSDTAKIDFEKKFDFVDIEIQKAKELQQIKLDTVELQSKTKLKEKAASTDIEIDKAIRKKKALNELADERKKNAEATRQQKKEIQLFISEVGKLNNAEKSLNTSENFANKLGKPELSNKIVHLREQVVSLNKQAQELFYSTNNGENLGDRLNDEGFKAFSESIKKVNKEVSELQQASTKDSPLFVENERLANQARDVSEFALSLEKFEKTNNKFKGNSGAAAEFERIKAALSDLERRSRLGETVGIELKELISDTNRWKASLEKAGLSGQTWFGKLQAQMQKLGVYFGASAVMMGAWRQVKQMTTNVIELDTAMTELKKVTNETDATYSKFLDNAEVRAKSLGATLVDTVNATADFSRLGYSLKEAEQISDAALVYKNVGDGIRDVNAASESVISSMKAYGVAASDAMSIVDRFNEVGNNFAISSKGVGDALQRSASALSVAGNSIDESIALVVAGNNVVNLMSHAA